MGVDRRLTLTYAVTNLLFIACGAVTVAVSIVWEMDAQSNAAALAGNVEQSIIFLMTPNMLGLIAGIITIIAGVASLPRMSPWLVC